MPTVFVGGLFSFEEDDERVKKGKVLCQNFKNIPGHLRVPASKHPL